RGETVVLRKPVVEVVAATPKKAVRAAGGLRREVSARVLVRPITDADLRRMTDDELLDRYHHISSQNTSTRPRYSRLTANCSAANPAECATWTRSTATRRCSVGWMI